MLEAMAAGVPVVATAVGGTPEVLDQGRAGYLVPPGQPEALALVMAQVLTDRAAAAERTQQARRFVGEEYSQAGMFRRFEALYEELL